MEAKRPSEIAALQISGKAMQAKPMQPCQMEAKPQTCQPVTVLPPPNYPCARLHVTPDIEIPSARKETIPLNRVMTKLASEESEKGLVDAGGMFNFTEGTAVLDKVHPHGFIAAATSAFASHYPMAIRPQHFWLMILQGASKHVEQNAEQVRRKWVCHEGKKTLEVRCDEFRLGSRNDWASVVDGKPDCFSAQISKNVVDGLPLELLPAFTETSSEENIALKITVMDVTKSFFDFKCTTMCGFPFMIMEGKPEDWQLLRRHAELLIMNRCERTFAERWCGALLPVLDKFIQEYNNAISGTIMPDEQFWNSMCKRGGTSGSGSRTWFNGWINIFFPYIRERLNPYMVPYSSENGYVKEGRDGGRYGMGAPFDVQGPDCADFPGGLAAAPVLWDYLGKQIDLKFKAGFVGAEQDQATGTVRPVVGWFIAHAGQGKK